MDIESSLKKLFSLHTFGIKLGLDNIIGFLNHLGNPQQQLKTIHIAGSNGKGSTASFIASILQEFGFDVGLYTSPHFVKFNERIVINGFQIDDEYVSTFLTENEKYIDENQLTFFEVTTALAFQNFKDKKPDYCVIETGLGGRLDATNVLNPLATVITSISLEHTNVLGDTIEEITNEKAAIIKSGSKVFTGLLIKEASDIIVSKCKETNCELFQLKNFISNDLSEVRIFSDSLGIQLKSPLKGNYQKINASLASLTISKTFHLEEEHKYLAGITNVIKNTGLQGRYEYYNKRPTIIFDSAHNPDGIQNFLKEFEKEAYRYKRRVLIFGVMQDKSIVEMLKLISKFFDEIFLTKIQYERAAKPEYLKELCDQQNIPAKIIDNPVKLTRDFKANREDECLVVLGSMYLLGEIKEQILQSTS